MITLQCSSWNVLCCQLLHVIWMDGTATLGFVAQLYYSKLYNFKLVRVLALLSLFALFLT